jgi:Rod binding domain-containing protein
MLELNTDYLPMPATTPLSPLTTMAEGVDPDKIAEASRQFEAIFLKQFLAQALKPLLHDTPGSQIAGAGIYEHMITDIIADNLSNSGDFGFASMLQAQLVGQLNTTDKLQN